MNPKKTLILFWVPIQKPNTIITFFVFHQMPHFLKFHISMHICFFQIYKNAKLQDFHIVGHSLGAHIAGYAGEKLISMNREAGKLGRITALDPAQPLFQNTPEFVRLDPGDADFVDVIHTDAKSILMGGLCNFDHLQLHIFIVI